MDPTLRSFLYGVAGNVSIEVVKYLGNAQRGRYHHKYGQWRFWIARTILFLLSGVLATAVSLSVSSTPLLAYSVGAGASLLIERMAASPPDLGGGSSED